MPRPRHPSHSLLQAVFALCALIALPQWASAQPVVFLDRDYNPNVTGLVVTTAWQADGKLLIGGNFTEVGGLSRSNLARLNADGSLDEGFAGTTVISGGGINSILPLPNGDILIGGQFTQVGSPALQTREGLARLRPDGTLDTGYVPPPMSVGDWGGRVFRLLRLSSGKIMVAGGFKDFGTPGRHRVARLNADGTLDAGFQPVAFGNDYGVLDMVEQADGKLIIAGYFQTVGGASHANLARLTATGAVDAGFVIGTGSDGVRRVLMQPDGKLVAAGDFTQVSASDHGATALRLARFNADLSVDTTFKGGADGGVAGMERQADGKLVISGVFNAVQNGPGPAWLPRSKLARLMPDGSLDTGFDPPGINGGGIFALTQQPDGRVILGGDFTAVGGVPRSRIARMVQMEPAAPAQAIVASHRHACAVRSGAAMCWGDNYNSQLGDGTTTLRRYAAPVSGLHSGVTAISTGPIYEDEGLSSGPNCVIQRGAAKCWGRNRFGQLGDGTTTDRSTPVQVSGLTSGVTAISAGTLHACALVTGGTVWCWGYNQYGQLGDGTTLHRYTPVQVAGLPGSVMAIAVGTFHTCAVTTGGAAWCWGNNFYGQLGDGTSADRLAPVQVSGLTSGMQAVDAGGHHTCALTTGGAVRCWGYNEFGQLGNGSTALSTVPAQVTGLTGGVTAISGGYVHTCASHNGAARCWGYNTDGQLGDGSTTGRLAPVQVSGLTSGVQAISAGTRHSCAIHNGTAKCWGNNSRGHLGNYLDEDSLAPVDVMTPLPAPTLSIFASGFEP